MTHPTSPIPGNAGALDQEKYSENYSEKSILKDFSTLDPVTVEAINAVLEMPSACTTDAEVIENNKRRERLRALIGRASPDAGGAKRRHVETAQTVAHELFAHDCWAFTGEGPKPHSTQCQRAAERLEEWAATIAAPTPQQEPQSNEAALREALKLARAQLVTLGGNIRSDSPFADQIQKAVLESIDRALSRPVADAVENCQRCGCKLNGEAALVTLCHPCADGSADAEGIFVTEQDREFARDILGDLGEEGLSNEEIVAQWVRKIRHETWRAKLQTQSGPAKGEAVADQIAAEITKLQTYLDEHCQGDGEAQKHAYTFGSGRLAQARLDLTIALASPPLPDIARQALETARDALASCYNVTGYPADGSTSQDAAISEIDAALSHSGTEKERVSSTDRVKP